MALTILDKPSIGGQLGASFGTGLKALAQNKLQQIERRNIAKGIQATDKNISPEEAEQLAYLDPSVLKQHLKGLQEKAFLGNTTGSTPNISEQGGVESEVAKEGKTKKSLIEKAIERGYSLPKNSKEYNDLIKNMHEQDIAERKEAFNETKEERKKFREDYRTAKNDLEDLGRLEELEDEGKLDDAGYIEGLKRAGLDIPALTNVGSEEFNKIANNFIRNAKQYYGSRISNLEMEQFLKTIPSLSQSPEGRKRVIANLKRIARGKMEYYNTYKEVSNENDGIITDALLDVIEDRVGKKLDKVSRQFKKDLERKVPEGPGALKTAAQIGAGELVGRAGPALANAVLGAGIGSALPGLGTLAGGGLGALYGLIQGK